MIPARKLRAGKAARQEPVVEFDAIARGGQDGGHARRGFPRL